MPPKKQLWGNQVEQEEKEEEQRKKRAAAAATAVTTASSPFLAVDQEIDQGVVQVSPESINNNEDEDKKNDAALAICVYKMKKIRH